MTEVKIMVDLGILTERKCRGTSGGLKMPYFFIWMVATGMHTYLDFIKLCT